MPDDKTKVGEPDRGGSNDFVNLATACRSCNLSKGSKAVEDWGAPGRLSPAGL